MDASNNEDDGTSFAPVRYSSGEINLSVSDLSSSGFGMPWGHTRSYGNRLGITSNGENGNHWFVEQIPTMVFEGSTVGVVGTVPEALWFNPSGGGYTPQFAIKNTLQFDESSSQYILMCANGQQTVFNEDGTFGGVIDAAGNTTTASYNSEQQLESMVFASGGETAGYYYTYYTSGDYTGQLQSVRYNVNGTDVRRCTYEYYGSSDSGGSQNDLQTANVEQYDATTDEWVGISTTYHNYYKAGDINGFAHGLKYVVNPEAYERMVADGISPETATDVQLAEYADYYFEYDSMARVIFEATDGGAYEYGFSYEASGNADDLNSWALKTTETLPDGSSKIVYTNYAGQVILSVLMSGSDMWYSYFQFDDNGVGILRAESSAVESYDESDPGLVTLNEGSGLIHLYEYFYDPADPGYAPGYFKQESIQEGSGGSEIALNATQYAAQTVGGNTVYQTAIQTLYQSADSGGSEAAETDYSYEYYTGSFQVQQMTATQSVVETDKNGSGTANSTINVYDTFGRVTWSMDARGFINHAVYDTATGAMIQQIVDVDTSIVSGAPSGWTTPAGGGLNLVTDYGFDDQGRITQVLGPSHEVDLGGTATTVRRAQWTVYQDAIDQTWAGQGYATGTDPDYTYTLINPVNITQVDQENRVTDQIQAIRDDTSGALSATDSFPQTSWSRWTHTDYDDQSHLVDQQVYFLIPSSGNGTLGANYNQTDYGYDVMGRQNRVEAPGGTITRTVYNPCNWLLETWVGTDDTGATNSDPSGGGAAGNNMVEVVGNQYDGGTAGGDGNLTQVMQYQDASTTRVTSYGYDFRNRKVYTDGEIDFYETYSYDNLNRLLQTDRQDTTSSGNLITRNATNYDPLGRAYQTIIYGVDPSTGTVGNALVSNLWYDPSGNMLKQLNAGSSAFQKMVYDGAGRMTLQYTSFNLSETAYPYPMDVSGDTVMQQLEQAYDAASNLISKITRVRFGNATGTGGLGGPRGPQPQARVYYQAIYYDPLGRQIAIANYGTGGSTINGDTSDYVASVVGNKLRAVYIDSSYGWSIK